MGGNNAGQVEEIISHWRGNEVLLAILVLTPEKFGDAGASMPRTLCGMIACLIARFKASSRVRYVKKNSIDMQVTFATKDE